MTDTAMLAAMTQAGADKNETRLCCEYARFLNQGGTVERARALLDKIADKMPGAGQRLHSAGANPPIPAARQTNAGAMLSLPDGHMTYAPATSREAGLRNGAEKAAYVLPAREPSRLQIEAMKRGRKRSALAIAQMGWLEKAIIPQGPRIIDVTWGSLNGFINRMKREGLDSLHLFYVLNRIKTEGDALGVMPDNARWIETMPEDVIRRIVEETAPEKVAKEARDFIASLGLTAFATALEHRHAG